MNSYRDPRPVANAAVLMLTIYIVALGISLVSQLAEASLLSRAETTGITFAEAETNDTRQAAVGLGSALVFFTTCIVFIVWFRRSYRNLMPLGVDRLRYSPGWAVGCWFIPIANFWIPKQIANDIWRGSEPTDDPRVIMTPQDPIPMLLAFWWAAWILGGLTNFDITFTFENADAPTLDNLQRASQFRLLGIAVEVVASLLAIKVVRDMTQRQEARAAALGRSAAQSHAD